MRRDRTEGDDLGVNVPAGGGAIIGLTPGLVLPPATHSKRGRACRDIPKANAPKAEEVGQLVGDSLTRNARPSAPRFRKRRGHGPDGIHLPSAATGDEATANQMTPIPGLSPLSTPIRKRRGRKECDTQGLTASTGGETGHGRTVPLGDGARLSSTPKRGRKAAGLGRARHETLGGCAEPNLSDEGQTCIVNQHATAPVAGDQEGHELGDTPPAAADLIATVIDAWRQREFLHRGEKGLTLAIKAKCRGLCKGDKGEAGVLYKAMMALWATVVQAKAEGASDAIAYAAASLQETTHEHALTAFRGCYPHLAARQLLADPRAKVEKQLRKHGAGLPTIEWWTAVRGLDSLGLVSIIGETGDLSLYANPGKVWKRMGLAVMSDGRQRKHKDKALAKEHGFSPNRRAVVWKVGDSLLKAQAQKVDKETGEVLRPAGPWRVLYDERKAYEIARNPEIRPIVAHARAKRYVEKRLLRDLWRAWREATQRVSPTDEASPAPIPLPMAAE